jgi:MerR family transcriptional regulator, thiopeptide resistance regulator
MCGECGDVNALTLSPSDGERVTATQQKFVTKTYTISKIARLCGLSRSTLLYYDRLGLLQATDRTGSNYRVYTEKDRQRLERIRHFREAGLTLKEIQTVLASGGKPGSKLLERRMSQTAANIAGLKSQQRLLAGMMRLASGKLPAAVDKKMWVEMLRAAGMDEQGMMRWHSEFERRAPGEHQAFLVSLGIPEEEVARIRQFSRDATTNQHE